MSICASPHGLACASQRRPSLLRHSSPSLRRVGAKRPRSGCPSYTLAGRSSRVDSRSSGAGPRFGRASQAPAPGPFRHGQSPASQGYRDVGLGTHGSPAFAARSPRARSCEVSRPSPPNGTESVTKDRRRPVHPRWAIQPNETVRECRTSSDRTHRGDYAPRIPPRLSAQADSRCDRPHCYRQRLTRYSGCSNSAVRTNS